MRAMEYGSDKGWAMLHPVSIVELTGIMKVCFLNENRQELFDKKDLREENTNIIYYLSERIEETLFENHVLWDDKKQLLVDVEFWMVSDIEPKEKDTMLYLDIFVSHLAHKREQRVTLFCRRVLFYAGWDLFIKLGTGDIVQKKEEELFQKLNINAEGSGYEQLYEDFEYYKKYCDSYGMKIDISHTRIRESCIAGFQNWQIKNTRLF